MLQQNEYDPQKVQALDERAHLVKVLDTAARIVREGIKKHGTVGKGVEFYYRPARVGKAGAWLYLHKSSNIGKCLATSIKFKMLQKTLRKKWIFV